jgi:hypothetical protein
MVDEERGGQEVAEHRELERALSLVKPAASTIDRDRFLFLAGRASAETIRPGTALGRWVWPAATLLSSLAAVVLSVLLVTRTQPTEFRVDSVNASTEQNRAAAVPNTAKPEVTAQSLSRRATGPSENTPEIAGPTIASSVRPTADETARALGGESNSPRLRSFVLAYGISALPEPAPIPQSASDSASNDEPRTQREMLRQLLNDRSASRTAAGSAG